MIFRSYMKLAEGNIHKAIQYIECAVKYNNALTVHNIWVYHNDLTTTSLYIADD